MPSPTRRWVYICIAFFSIFSLYMYQRPILGWHKLPEVTPEKLHEDLKAPSNSPAGPGDGTLQWNQVKLRYPVSSMIQLPTGTPARIPKIQKASFRNETAEVRKIRQARLLSVKENFAHAWKGYRQHAWMKDEVLPLSGGYRDTFGGWAATLVDSLDTLWIMGMQDEFAEAVGEIDKISFSSASQDEINLFETVIRYLGGFLSAYDLSGDKRLLSKAVDLGEMLYVAFDTPNRMPVTHWNWKAAAAGEPQEASIWTVVAEIGSLSLEFTRLTQVSGDPKYFDAIQRITDYFDSQQNLTQLPGMWPIGINAKEAIFTGDITGENTFTVGALSDSLYEYLPKQYMLLGGLSNQYQRLYENSVHAMKKHNFFRPLNPKNLDILISGSVIVKNSSAPILDPRGQHLVCFAGGMIGIAAQIFNHPSDLHIARKLVDGCIWAYESMPTGIMPEVFHAIPCGHGEKTDCQWSEEKWHRGIHEQQRNLEDTVQALIQEQRLNPGFTDYPDSKYILRPEVVESLFILYRITSDPVLQSTAWSLFQSILRHTRTSIAHAAIADVTTAEEPLQVDSMESFWTAETLKYFFLIFSDPDVISLDDYVFNTEAHPFRRPKAKGS